MSKNWRQIQWKDFTANQKIWFCIMWIWIIVILILACLSTAEIVEVPDWIVLSIVAIGFIAFCKFVKLTPWALMGFDFESEENEPYDCEDKKD